MGLNYSKEHPIFAAVKDTKNEVKYYLLLF